MPSQISLVPLAEGLCLHHPQLRDLEESNAFYGYQSLTGHEKHVDMRGKDPVRVN